MSRSHITKDTEHKGFTIFRLVQTSYKFSGESFVIAYPDGIFSVVCCASVRAAKRVIDTFVNAERYRMRSGG